MRRAEGAVRSIAFGVVLLRQVVSFHEYFVLWGSQFESYDKWRLLIPEGSSIVIISVAQISYSAIQYNLVAAITSAYSYSDSSGLSLCCSPISGPCSASASARMSSPTETSTPSPTYPRSVAPHIPC